MEWQWVAAIIAVLFVLSLFRRSGGSKTPTDEYRRKGALLTKAERSFFGVLQQAAGEQFLVFSKVRVADVLAPAKGYSKSRWRSAFNRISAKHFDFVLCDPASLDVHCVIELNDKSHAKRSRSARDEFIRDACQSADLRLIEVPASQSYSLHELRDLLQEQGAS